MKETSTGMRFIVLLRDNEGDGEAIVVENGRIVKVTYWLRDWDDLVVKDVPKVQR